MKLTLGQIKEITFGCVDITEEDGKFCFYRFTREQSDAYRRFRVIEFQRKTLAAAGVRIAFRTDSDTLSFDYKFSYGSSRPFGWFDVYIDGVMTGHFGGEGLLFSSGHADMNFPEGEKFIEIYFPWSKAVAISDFRIDDGSSLIPQTRPHTMLCFGDSITQGYDAVYPSFSYASQLSRRFDCNLYNKAIGGDSFFPELLYAEDKVDPDIITVSYGTNDWSMHKRERMIVSGRAFCEKLVQKYPDAKIFIFTPIWNGDGNRETPFGSPHSTVGGVIKSFCEGLPVTVIDGMPLAPHCADFYADQFLHPNDLGFCVLANGFYTEMLKYM